MTTFPDKKVLVIAVSLLANGISSYRDVNNIENISKKKWNADVIIISDNSKHINDKQNCTIVTNKKQFLEELENNIAKFSDICDILFTISAHGYSNNKHQYITVNGSKILDYEIRDSFYKNMNDSCLSLCLIDTCHSGTMLDLPFISDNGKTFKEIKQNVIIKPKSFCISACNDNELAGEDISNYGGWGGKLICIFLDYVDKEYVFNIENFYCYVLEKFTAQVQQKSHPLLSKTI